MFDFLHFDLGGVPPEPYFLFAFLASLGTLQWVAARNGLNGLAFIPPEHRRAGQWAGGILVVGATGWFYVSQYPLIFRPGLAGFELLTIFVLGALAALAVSRAGAALRHVFRQIVALSSVEEETEA